MEESLLDKFRRALTPAITLFDRIGFAWLWMCISLMLLLLVVSLNPAKLGSYVWFVSKICGAAALGYGFDWAFFRGSDPRYMGEGLEKTMAQTRRATLIASGIIGAGLIG